MAVIELIPYDFYTSPAERIYALQPLWANLASLGAASARLLVVTDHINYTNAIQGFNKVAVPPKELVRDLRWFRSYYEQYMRDTIRETQYIRLFLVISSTLDENTLARVIEGYGVRTRTLDGAGVPLPFEVAEPNWDSAYDPVNDLYWGTVQSSLDQTGAVMPQTLHKVFALDFPVYLAIDIWNYSRTDAVRLLKMKAAAAGVQFGKKGADRQQQIEANETHAAIDRFRQEIGTSGIGIHEMRVTIAVNGRSPAELDNKFELVRGACSIDFDKRRSEISVLPEMFSATPPNGYARKGSLCTSRHVTVLAGSAQSYGRPTKLDGVLMGFDAAQSPVVIDVFNKRNKAYNAVVVGQTGSGKTFGVTLLMIRALLTGSRMILIDPKGDIDMSWLGGDGHGRPLANKISVGKDGFCVNILDKTFPELNNQIEFVLGGLRMLGIYGAQERLKHTLLDTALFELYQMADAAGRVPTLPELAEVIQKIGGEQQGNIQEMANELVFALQPFTHGSRAQLFGQATNIDLSLGAPVNIFDVSAFPSRQTGGSMRAMLFATLFGLINQSILNRRKRPKHPDLAPIMFFVDEIGVLMRDPVVADYVSDKYKTARSLRVSMIVADQTVASLLGVADEQGIRHGHEMFANAPFKFIFFQEDSEMHTLDEQFPMMPEAYRRLIHRLPRGQCVAQNAGGDFQDYCDPFRNGKSVAWQQLG